MGRQIDQRDLFAAALRDFDLVGKVLGHRIVQRNFAALHHVGEDGGREDFGGRADLEDRIVAHWTGVLDREVAVGDEAASVSIDDADGNPDVPMQLVDAVAKNRADLCVGKGLRAQGNGGEQKIKAAFHD